jgi:hypothetical protein
MESRQSDARNKIIAPVFKSLGIIDQWGNGLKLIAGELKEYPDIEFRWKEVGLSFQVQFVKLNYKDHQELGQELGQELRQEQKEKTLFSLVLTRLRDRPLSRKELMTAFGLKKVSGYLNMNDLVAQVEKSLNKNIPSTYFPYWLGMLGGYGFDILSKLTAKKFSVSSVRVKKFCATTQFDATKAHNCGFKAPYTLSQGLHNTLHYEFIEKQKDGITFESE